MAFTTIKGSGANDATTFVGTSGVDAITFVGSTTNFFLDALGENDSITFVDNISSPTVISNGTLSGGDGVDLFFSNSNSNSNNNNDSNNVIGYFNNVLINGNAGNDIIEFYGRVYAGSTVFGGDGNDEIQLDGSLLNSRVNGNNGDDVIGVSGSVYRSSIFGGQGDDKIGVDGFYSDTLISGDVGDDHIVVEGGLTNVTINGNADDDIIDVSGSISESSIFGGQGDDEIDVDGSYSDVLISGDVGDDLIVVGGVLTNVTINGNADDDIIDVAGVLGKDDVATGDTFSTDVSVFGGKGDDLITAVVPDDEGHLEYYNDASTANLKLYGNDGDDTIFGGYGEDTITGGTGADTLTGGGGGRANTFVFATGDSLAATAKADGEVTFGDGVDVITDPTDLDKFILNGLAINLANKDAVTGEATIDSAGNYMITNVGTAFIETNTYFHVHGTFDVDGVFEYTGFGYDSALFFQTASGAKVGDKINSTSVEAFIVIYPPYDMI